MGEICKNCGADNPIVIRGYPNFGAVMDLRKQGHKVVLGGCVAGPSWYPPCRKCGYSAYWGNLFE